MSRRSVTLVLLVVVMLVALAAPGLAAKPSSPNPVALQHANEHSRIQQEAASQEAAMVADGTRVTVAGVELLGVDVLPDNTYFDGTLIGGLSGMTYDPINDVYYIISDDKSEFSPARYYTVSVGTDPVSVQFDDVTFIRDHGGLYPEGSIDLEGIEWFSKNKLFVSNERDEAGVPSVLRLNPNARVDRSLRLPWYFIPGYDGTTQTSGVNTNLAFESLTLTPDHNWLVTATESALVQDGKPSDHTAGSDSRVLEFSVPGLQPAHEYVYPVGPIPKGVAADDGDNGLSEMVAIDNVGTFLAMERSYVGGFGNTIRLYETSTAGATDVSGRYTLTGKMYVPMSKRMVVDLEDDLGLVPGTTLDNMEGMAFGPKMSDGRYPLVIVSDDNFNPTYQNTVFIVLAVTLEPAD
jgi:3-phytase